MAKAKRGGGRKISLAAFLRKLWSNADLMERFSQSREGRQQVIREFNLNAKHAKLLLEGCVNDIVRELAGATKKAQNMTTVINCDRSQADVQCGHAECEAFMKSVANKPIKKKKR